LADPQVEITSRVAAPDIQIFAQASRLEWLQTNHTGAFSMGTVCGVNTRRYHGLLIATLNPPADRYSIFPRVEDSVVFGGKTFDLATVQYPGAVTPAGFELLEEFSAVPCPTWRYRCDNLTVEKSVRLLDGEQSVVLTYSAQADCQIHIRLFLSFRDYHSVSKQNPSLSEQVLEQPGSLKFRPYPNLPPLSVFHNAASFEHTGAWFHNHEYLRELERGLDYLEDLYSPGILHFNVAAGEPVHLIATLEDSQPEIKTLIVPANPIAAALNQFRVRRADGRPTLIAGYPWFTDWSRDTLISLPALMACGFEASETKAILEFLLAERKQGILPNRFSDQQSTPEYNTVDASLWFFIAAHSYVAHSQVQSRDLAFIQTTLMPAALDIIEWHKRGTFYGIHVDLSDHLLAAGQAGTQLTWMDAKIGDYVVTPRIGKPVEINALWFNALRIAAEWAAMLGNADTSNQLLSEAAQVQKSFREKFWNAERNCLYDVLTETGPDASLRPNQLFALSLPFPLLDRPRAQAIVQLAEQVLLTPAGLRTLEPADPRYCPRFEGDMRSRDFAYHQGTVWPWLIGPYIGAYLYAHGNTAAAKAASKTTLNSVLKLMNRYCLGSLGEVYDGDYPHRPGGCPAQLWSVAQVALALNALEP
jgi:predicted glycogen debranching enzyme